MSKPINLIKVKDDLYFLVIARNADIDIEKLLKDIKEKCSPDIITIIANYADEGWED